MNTDPAIQEILCVTDLSDFSNAAVPLAAILAERFGSELYLGHVLELPYRQNLMITALEIEEGIWERKRQ